MFQWSLPWSEKERILATQYNVQDLDLTDDTRNMLFPVETSTRTICSDPVRGFTRMHLSKNLDGFLLIYRCGCIHLHVCTDLQRERYNT